MYIIFALLSLLSCSNNNDVSNNEEEIQGVKSPNILLVIAVIAILYNIIRGRKPL